MMREVRGDNWAACGAEWCVQWGMGWPLEWAQRVRGRVARAILLVVFWAWVVPAVIVLGGPTVILVLTAIVTGVHTADRL